MSVTISSSDEAVLDAVRKEHNPILFSGRVLVAQTKKFEAKFASRMVVVTPLRLIECIEKVAKKKSPVSASFFIVRLTEIEAVVVDEKKWKPVYLVTMHFSHGHGSGEAKHKTYKLKCALDVARQLTQTLILAANKITAMYPPADKPVFKVDDALLEDMEEPPKSTEAQDLSFAYTVACDELGIAEDDKVRLGLLQSTSEGTLDLRSLYFPEATISTTDISSQTLNHADCLALSMAIRLTRRFHTLSARGVPITDESFAALGGAALVNSKIKSIRLIDCQHPSPTCLKRLSMVCESVLPRLTTIDFSENTKFSDAGIANFARGLFYCKSLERLSLRKCGFAIRGFEAICDALSICERLVETIKYVDLSDNRAKSKGSCAIAQWLQVAKNLETLILIRADVQVSTIVTAIQSNHHLSTSSLTTLNLSGNKIDKDCGAPFMQVLSTTNSLSRLFLQACKLSKDVLQQIVVGISKNPSARRGDGVKFELDITANSLGDSVSSVFEKVLVGPVRCLDTFVCSQNNLKEGGMASLCESLGQLKSLRVLVLDNNVRVGHFNSSRDNHGEELAKLCKSLPTLEILSINGDEESVFCIKNGLNPFLKSLGSNHSLTHLQLRENRFSDTELTLLAEALETNRTLRVLDVDQTRAGPQGLIALINVIKTSQYLYEALPTNDIAQLTKTKNAELKLTLLMSVDEARHRLRANREGATTAELLRAGVPPKVLMDCDSTLGHRRSMVSLSLSGCKSALFTNPDEDGLKFLREQSVEAADLERSPSEVDLDLQRQKGHQFGVDIIDIVGTVKVPGLKGRVPTVLVQMRDFMMEHGASDTVGIFRLAPGAQESARVEQKLNDANFESTDDVNAVANCLKVWFRKLPERLLDHLTTEQLECVTTPTAARDLLNSDAFKEPHRSVFYWLLDFCSEIAENEAVNRMSPKNLAIVFVPNLFQDSKLDPMTALKFSDLVSRFFENAVRWRMNVKVDEDEAKSAAKKDVASAGADETATDSSPPVVKRQNSVHLGAIQNCWQDELKERLSTNLRSETNRRSATNSMGSSTTELVQIGDAMNSLQHCGSEVSREELVKRKLTKNLISGWEARASMTSACSSKDGDSADTRNEELLKFCEIPHDLHMAYKTDSRRTAGKWKKRRFEVERGVLRYYKKGTLKGEKLKGTINLDQCSLRALVGTVKGRTSCFDLLDRTSGRIYLLSTENPGDFPLWKNALLKHRLFCKMFPDRQALCSTTDGDDDEDEDE